MTYPRAHLVDSANGGYYHCISRCVRQSWLCGKDTISGKSFEHRRHWIKRRIEHLATIFAIDVYAYAIMSNHYHIVVKLDPKRTKKWSDSEVATRWLSKSPASHKQVPETEELKRLIEDPHKIRQLRTRLGSLSWFMRYINEPLARLANAEDECSGRFWEGRFKSVALLDSTAILNCMIYVDLNPNRAGSSVAIPSAHTSAKARLSKGNTTLGDLRQLNIDTATYLELLTWTGRKKKLATQRVRSTLSRLRQSEQQWKDRVRANAQGYRAYGLKESIAEYVVSLGQQWLQMPALRAY